MNSWPAYLALAESGELADRLAQARELLSPCRLCPRECGARRLEGERGHCRAGAVAKVASFSPHFGEETPLVGRGGSGTIFFCFCNLGCLFCQNYDISHLAAGEEVSPQTLAGMMLRLQQAGCHNINFVTPTHFLPQMLEALGSAIDLGLRLPIVYNCGGYESLAALRVLHGLVDIYMPDAKFADGEVARRLCQAPDYPERMRAAIAEMHRQAGDLTLDGRGIARRGLLVRHLVMPNGLAGSREVLTFLASLSRNTYVNVMAQYRPCYQAGEIVEINRPITPEEHREATRAARDAGLTRLD